MAELIGYYSRYGDVRELLATVPGYANLVTAYEKADAEREREKAYEEEDGKIVTTSGKLLP